MDKKEEDWIEENMGDPIHEDEGNFEGEIWMSTDGKHTVRAQATTPEGRKAGLKWANLVYKRLMYTYGSKQSQAVKEYANTEKQVKVDAHICPIHNKTMTEREFRGRKWFDHRMKDSEKGWLQCKGDGWE